MVKRGVSVVLLTGLLLMIPTTASANVTGKVCQALSHNGKRVSICSYVKALDADTARAVAANGGGVQQANIEVDYVRLWIHTFFPDGYDLRGSNETNYVPGNTPWTIWTQNNGFYCSGSGQHSRLHAEVRYRPLWAGGNGSWHILNSNEAECQA